MKISRRQFLKYTAGAASAIGFTAGGFAAASGQHRAPHALLHEAGVAGAGNPLRIPGTFSGTTITAARSTQAIWPGAPTEVWTYGGSYPAPTIRVRRGAEFMVQLHNTLEEHTNIHWHGLMVPAAMDGYPGDYALPGGWFDYIFTVRQRAGTYWYHPHPHMRTGAQVYMGMAGLFIVEDDEQGALDLPSGANDIPLVIQDRRLTPNRTLEYNLTGDDHVDGYLGDVLLVNGTPEAYLEVESGLYRFRVLNGSNARVLDLALADESPMLVIGTDGGLLDRPYEVTHTYLAPAERVELLIDFSRYGVGQSIGLKSLPFSGGSGREQGAEMQVMRFDVTRTPVKQWQVPATLTQYERLDPATAARTRAFTLRLDQVSDPPTHTMNNLTFDMARIDERVTAGDVEIWRFENITFLHHPMHLHGTLFQVVSRSFSQELDPCDLGWKDTVYVRPYETVEVVVRFPDLPGKFLVHCHNLEHEDHGMMLNFEITSTSSVENADEPLPTRMDLR